MASGQLPQQSGVPGMNFSYNINEETTEIQCEINEDLTIDNQRNGLETLD